MGRLLGASPHGAARRLLLVAVASTAASSGCRIGFRSTGGDATLPSQASVGRTNMIRMWDEGGLLTRIGLGLAGGAVALGSISNVNTTQDTNRVGDTVVTTTTTTGTLDTAGAQAGADIANSDGKIAESYGRGRSFGASFAGGLDIASESLGGDTSGWQGEFGFAARSARFGRAFGWGWRASLTYGYGKFTAHERLLERQDRGPPDIAEELEHKFSGVNARFGLFMFKPPRSLKGLLATETYGKAELNLSDGSVYRLGQRLQVGFFYVEAELVRGNSGASTSMEVGFGF